MQPIIRLILAFTMGMVCLGAHAESPMIYGFMASSDEWRDLQDQAYEQYGWYTFRADGSTPFQAISPIDQDQEWALYGGVYVDGVYYGYSASGTFLDYTLNFHGISAKDWSTVVSKSFHYKSSESTSEESQRAILVPSDMAYEPLSGVVYASTRRFKSDADSKLCTVDLKSGILTPVGSIPNLCALACGPDGQLWGISIEDASLYKIGKDASYEKVGATGFYPFRDSERTQSATYDFASGKIYWSFYGFASAEDRNYNRNAIFAMLTVDPATGKTEVVWNYPRDQRFSSINIMNAHPLAPADIADLAFALDGVESLNGTISFTVPAVTAGNSAATEAVQVAVLLDGKEFDHASATPGSKYSKKVENLAKGNHTVCVTLSSNGHEGNPAYATTFFGYDVPAAVRNLTLSSGAGATSAVLKWDAPENGVSGFPLNTANIRYKVVRYPGEVTVARSLTATEWTEEITSVYGPIFYTVTPYNVNCVSEPGAASRSNTLMLGTDITIPYTETFDSPTSFKTFTTVDVDGDGNDEWRSPCWKYDSEYNCAFYYGVKDYPANDWLITPPLQLNPEKMYRLKFHQYAFYGYGTSLRVALGAEPTAEVMTKEIADLHTLTTFYDKPGRLEEVMFVPAEGQRFIGFLHYSENMEHLSIDDISVEEAGDARVPERATELTATTDRDDKVVLSFKAPELTLQGKPLGEKLTVIISRTADGDAIQEFKDVEPGKALTWTDKDCVAGVNAYYVVAINSIGRGLAAEVIIDLSEPAPESVAMAYTRYINDRQVEITWEPSPTDDARYLVYRIIPGEYENIYKVIGRDLDGLRMVDDAPATGFDENMQNYIQYYVAPVNGGGEGIATLTTGVFVGEAYTLPYSETWKDQTEVSGPWARASQGASWYVHGWAYDPWCKIPDGMGLLDLEANGSEPGWAFIYSPRIDLTTQTEPLLKFKMYRSNFYNKNVRVRAAIQKEGEDTFEYVGAVHYPYTTTEGAWEECSVDLSKFAGCDRCSIVLVGYTVPDQRVHITDLSITGKTDNTKVKAEYITGAAEVYVNDEPSYTAFIKNYTATDATDVEVDFLVDGVIVQSATIGKIPAKSRESVEFEYEPAKAGENVLSIRVQGALTDPTPATKEVTVKEYNYPAVNDLTMMTVDEGTSRKVSLKWTEAVRPEKPAENIDGFETYDTFTVTDFGAWSLHDGDGYVPFSMAVGGSVLEWDNYKSPQAFIVFDPEYVESGAPFGPQSGLKAAVSFGSPFGANNDWLISPELSGLEQLISFYIRSVRGSGKEHYNFLVSTTDTKPASFTALNGNAPLTAPADWDLRYFSLPEGTRYFAIQYVGDKQDGIVVDDVRLDGYFSTVRPDSYNVYRNGELIGEAEDSSKPFEYVDDAPAEDAAYTVRPVFMGFEGGDSNAVRASTSGLGGLTAADGCTFTASRGLITVRNANAAIEVFALDGRKIASAPAAEKVEINIAAGIYIVRCGHRTAKLAVK